MDEDFYVRHFSSLVQLEREVQMRMHEEEMRNLSGKEREKKGRAFLRMRGKYLGLGLGGKHLVKFMKQSGEMLPESEIEVGDIVLVSKTSLWAKENPTGTVAEKTKYSITVSFDEKPPKFVFSKDLRIDLYINDVTFQRMLEALRHFKSLPTRKKKILLGKEEPKFVDIRGVEFFNQGLNRSQKEAVLGSIAAKDLFLIHGPPGTGKTVTCIEVITQLVRKFGLKVLATADSNIAVDNLVEGLERVGINVVRVGHPARVVPALRRRSLDFLIQDEHKYKEAQKLRERAMKLKELQERFVFPEMKWRRGLSDKTILRLADRGKTVRGIPKRIIKGMGEWLRLKKRIDDLYERAYLLEGDAVNKILSEAEVVCATNSTAGSEILENFRFDVAVIDEATQSTEPSSLIAIIKADKFIMAGDHRQLPPTVQSEEAARRGLSKSMFERLLETYGKRVYAMLKVQYRMNEEIADFPNNEFYGGEIQTPENVKNRNIKDLLHKDMRLREGLAKLILSEKPAVFIDTAHRFRERTRYGSTSKENEGEASLVCKIVEILLEAGVRPEEIGVISPYDDQVSLLRRMLPMESLEIKSVDGFQGREKEIIIVSFVRSNEEGDIGFLNDLRRLNVSLTRAKRKRILIGDAFTLKSNPCYHRLIEWHLRKGALFTYR
ncbi:MAG: IGHMBP2 family helicase [Candidatus Methanospirareceae archaeon]